MDLETQSSNSGTWNASCKHKCERRPKWSTITFICMDIMNDPRHSRSILFHGLADFTLIATHDNEHETRFLCWRVEWSRFVVALSTILVVRRCWKTTSWIFQSYSIWSLVERFLYIFEYLKHSLMRLTTCVLEEGSILLWRNSTKYKNSTQSSYWKRIKK